MSEGHDGGGYGAHGQAACDDPVAGDGNVGIVSTAPAPGHTINGITIDRAAILEKSKERRFDRG